MLRGRLLASFAFPGSVLQRRWWGTTQIDHRKRCEVHGAHGFVRRAVQRASIVNESVVTGSVVEAGRRAIEECGRFREYLLTPPAGFDGAVEIEGVKVGEFARWLEEQAEEVQAWAKGCGFDGEKAGKWLLIPNFSGEKKKGGKVGQIEKVVLVVGDQGMWEYAGLPVGLPPGIYCVGEKSAGVGMKEVELGWALGCYTYGRYKKEEGKDMASLMRRTEGEEKHETEQTAAALYMVRDLVNAPAEDLGPAGLEAATRSLAREFGARCRSVVGRQLVEEGGWDMVHAVGRAASPGREPRVVEIVWDGADGRGPTVTLVGKGVVFDSGGLDIKTATGMRLMKKDMAGSAQVLGLARLIMAAKLPIRLRVLIAAVENTVGRDSYRPGDILRGRNGVTTEIDNTDAEGRLILADCLASAAEESPALIIDCATLTGSQMVALGTDIPAIFSNDQNTAAKLCELSVENNDLVWQLPLHKPYRKQLDSTIADIKNCSPGPYGGAITAALYLNEFVPKDTPWIHVDFMGYNTSSSPGRPEGGEAGGMRALFSLVKHLYPAAAK